VIFLDVGANVGTFALPVAAHGFRVIAYEAMFSNQLALRLSLCANPDLQDRLNVVPKVGTSQLWDMSSDSMQPLGRKNVPRPDIRGLAGIPSPLGPPRLGI
jgi:hypothetical protein